SGPFRCERLRSCAGTGPRPRFAQSNRNWRYSPRSPACAQPGRAAQTRRLRSISGSPSVPSPNASSALTERGLDKTEAARVERGGRLVIHLVRGDLEHFVFEVHAIAAGAHLEVALVIHLKDRLIVASDRGEVARCRLRQAQRGHRRTHRIRRERSEIARLEL